MLSRRFKTFGYSALFLNLSDFVIGNHKETAGSSQRQFIINIEAVYDRQKNKIWTELNSTGKKLSFLCLLRVK